MTTQDEVTTTTSELHELARSADRAPHPAPPAPDRCGAAASEEHRHHRQGVAGADGRRGGLDRRRGALHLGASGHRSGRRRALGTDRTLTHRLADPRHGAIDRVGTGYIGSAIAIGLIVALMVFRRWRHLFTLVGATLVVGIVTQNILYRVFSRPRAYDVTIIGRWAGYSFPSPPVAAFTIVLRRRSCTRWSSPAGRARSPRESSPPRSWPSSRLALYLAVDHPFDVAGRRSRRDRDPLNAFRFFTPNEVVPGHLPPRQDGAPRRRRRRGEAIRQAVAGPARPRRSSTSSRSASPAPGGSTPLRLRVAGDPDTYLFGKLYAMNHVRADRWYKLGPHHPLRTPRGRGAVPDACGASSSTRTTRCGSCVTRASRPPRRTASSR